MNSWLLDVWDKLYSCLFVADRYKMVLSGLWVTLEVTLLSFVLGTALGFVIAFMQLSNARIGRFYPLRWLAGIYTTVIRGTPVVLQLMIFNFVIFAPFNVPKLLIAVTAFTINSAAYVSEMVRGGILSVDRGQTEAGRSLGLSGAATMRLIIMPQTIKLIFPSLCNEFIMLLKETAIVGYIAIMDLAKAADYIRSRTFEPFMPYFISAGIYLIIVSVLSKVFSVVEGRMRQGDLR